VEATPGFYLDHPLFRAVASGRPSVRMVIETEAAGPAILAPIEAYGDVPLRLGRPCAAGGHFWTGVRECGGRGASVGAGRADLLSRPQFSSRGWASRRLRPESCMPRLVGGYIIHPTMRAKTLWRPD